MISLFRNTPGWFDAEMTVIANGGSLEAGTVYCYAKRASDSKWLQADLSWNAVKPVGADIPTMTHVSGGLWILSHTPADADDTYYVNCIDSGATCYADNYTHAVLNVPAKDLTVAKETTLANVASNITTIYNRLGAFTGTGVNTVLRFFKAILKKDATIPSDIGGTFDPATDSNEAIAERLNNVGGLTGAHTVTVQFYRTATTTPIPDVLCDVYDSTETTRLNGTQLKSDVNGQISFARDNGTYKVRAMLSGFTFTTGTVTITDGNATLTMYGAAITIPNPPVAGTQTLFGNVRELDWGVSTGDTITAVIADKGQVVNGALIQHLNLSTTVDANSQFSLTVPKGSVIRLTVKDHGTHEITINQEDTYDVATYLTE